MAITDLIPWKKDETRLPIRRREEDTLVDFMDRMNRLIDEMFGRPLSLTPFFESESTWLGDFTPKMDVSETDKEITIEMELPGLKPEDVNITLERGVLNISGEKQSEKEEKGRRFYRMERSYGSFYRSIPLPSEVEEGKIEAIFKHGVLKVKLPKTQAAQAQSKRITIKAD